MASNRILHVRLPDDVAERLDAYCASTHQTRTAAVIQFVLMAKPYGDTQPNAPSPGNRRASAVPARSALERSNTYPTEVMAFVDGATMIFVRDKASPIWREVTLVRNNNGGRTPTRVHREPTGKTADDLGLDVWAMLQDSEAQELSFKDERVKASITNHPDYFEPHPAPWPKSNGKITYADAMGEYGPAGKVYSAEDWKELQRKAGVTPMSREAEPIIPQDNEAPGSRLGDFTTPIAALMEDD